MRKSSLALAALTLAVLAGSSLNSSFASHCGKGTPASRPSAHDPFGSCEEGGASTKGNVRCGSGGSWQSVGGASGTPQIAKVNADHTKGAQVCNDGTGNPTPPPYIIQGRVVAYYSGTNVVIAADGDKDNSTNLNPSAAGWNRVDVRPTDSRCKVRMRRGQSTGNYWHTSSGATTATDGNNGLQDTCTQGLIP